MRDMGVAFVAAASSRSDRASPTAGGSRSHYDRQDTAQMW